MKTTFELPDSLLREAKSMAAARGQSLRQFFTDAIADRLKSLSAQQQSKPWMKHFGSLSEHAEELRRLDEVVAGEFENIDPGDWR